MDIEQVRKLLDELVGFMKKNDLAELELDTEGAKVKLRKTGSHLQHHVVAAPVHAIAPAPVAAASPAAPGEEAIPAGAMVVKSPMVGTFYRSPKPDADHFVEIGDEVDEDTPLCIIEAMKVMNEIKAEHKGRIHSILVENGEPVEFGQPLFYITAQ